MTQKTSEIGLITNELFAIARDTIIVRYRYFNMAISVISPIMHEQSGSVSIRGNDLYYDPFFVAKKYAEDNNYVIRLYFHILMHKLFSHEKLGKGKNEKYWALAADIACEATAIDITGDSFMMAVDQERKKHLGILSNQLSRLTAQMIYKHFINAGLSDELYEEYVRLFSYDQYIEPEEDLFITNNMWDRLRKIVEQDLKSFSKDKGSSLLEEAIWESQRKTYDYKELLSSFLVSNEELKVSDEEFDYNYYTYGLYTYGNMPLIEPLEYCEANKIKELAIAIDTSGSCKGETILSFLQKTYEILMLQESFFDDFNIRIIMCDNKIVSDTKLTSKEEFLSYITNSKVGGFGGTDFRPVFEHIEKLISQKEFEDLKGLIYFTDGYGIYPEVQPDYDVIFAFLHEDKGCQEVPWWALKVVVEEELC